MRAPEAGIAARVGRAAEADLVPRPRVRVERLAGVPYDERPRAADVEPAPDAAVESRLGEAVADVDTRLDPGLGEGRRAERARLVVEAPDDAPPDLAIVGQVEEPVAVELAIVQLLVDVRRDGDPRLRVLRRDRVAKGLDRL